MMGSCKCFPHMNNKPTIIFNRVNSVIIRKPTIILNIIHWSLYVGVLEINGACVHSTYYCFKVKIQSSTNFPWKHQGQMGPILERAQFNIWHCWMLSITWHHCDLVHHGQKSISFSIVSCQGQNCFVVCINLILFVRYMLHDMSMKWTNIWIGTLLEKTSSIPTW